MIRAGNVADLMKYDVLRPAAFRVLKETLEEEKLEAIDIATEILQHKVPVVVAAVLKILGKHHALLSNDTFQKAIRERFEAAGTSAYPDFDRIAALILLTLITRPTPDFESNDVLKRFGIRAHEGDIIFDGLGLRAIDFFLDDQNGIFRRLLTLLRTNVRVWIGPDAQFSLGESGRVEVTFIHGPTTTPWGYADNNNWAAVRKRFRETYSAREQGHTEERQRNAKDACQRAVNE